MMRSRSYVCLSPYGELLYGERRLLPQRQVAEFDAGLDVACPSTCGNTKKLANLHGFMALSKIVDGEKSEVSVESK